MKKKNNKLEFFLLLILVISFGVLLYYYFYNNMSINNTPSVVGSQEVKVNTEYEKQKTDIMPILSSFKKYGDWPEIPYQLSPSRGNPFQEKLEGAIKDNNI